MFWLIVALLPVASYAFGFGLGCGCGLPPPPPICLPQIQLPPLCPPPPPPCVCQVCVPCGCGRKKRQAIAPVAELVRSDENKCNNDQLREIILNGIRTDARDAKSIIHSEARRKLGGNWVVLCSSAPVSFVSQSQKFCQDGHDDTWCHAFQIDN